MSVVRNTTDQRPVMIALVSGPKTINEIRAATGLSDSRVRTGLKYLLNGDCPLAVRSGHRMMGGNGAAKAFIYSLTETGMTAATADDGTLERMMRLAY
jgi:hypothetical protein